MHAGPPSDLALFAVATPLCRDSKLTRILEDSLGGNCKTTFLAMVSPAVEAFQGVWWGACRGGAGHVQARSDELVLRFCSPLLPCCTIAPQSQPPHPNPRQSRCRR